MIPNNLLNKKGPFCITFYIHIGYHEKMLLSILTTSKILRLDKWYFLDESLAHVRQPQHLEMCIF